MSSDSGGRINLDITLAEIDEILCEKCKRKLRELIRSKVPDEIIESFIKKKS